MKGRQLYKRGHYLKSFPHKGEGGGDFLREEIRDMSRNAEICPDMSRKLCMLLRDWHHKVSSPIKVHQNTQNSLLYKVILK